MASFTGAITYIRPVVKDDSVVFELEGTINIAKGLLEYPATPDWQSVWRIYNQFGKLLFEDARHHSIMPFSQADSATDSFTAKVEKTGRVYTVQLWGRLAGETSLVDQKSVDIVTNIPAITPTPVPQPSPEPVPTPFPTPVVPTPKPPTPPLPTPFVPKLVGMGGLILVLLLLFIFARGRK